MSHRYNITISSAAAANNKLYLHLIEHDQWIREDYYLPNALGWHGFNGKYFSGRYFDHNFSPIDMISRSRHKIHRCIIEKVVPYWYVENLSARFKKEFSLFLFSRNPFVSSGWLDGWEWSEEISGEFEEHLVEKFLKNNKT